MPPLHPLDVLGLDHWFDPRPGLPSPYYALLGLLLAAGLAAGVYFSFFHVRRKYASHALKSSLFSRFGLGFAVLFGVGLVLVGLRYVGIPYLSARFLLYLDLIAVLGLAGFAGFYFVRLFPTRLAAYDAEALRRRYLPRPGTGKGGKKRKGRKDNRRP